MAKKPDLRLNQLLDRFLRRVFGGLEECRDCGSFEDGIAVVKLVGSGGEMSW